MLMVCALALIPAFASSNAPVSQQLSTEARELRVAASEVAKVLKQKQADMAQVESRLDQFVQRASQINTLVAQAESNATSLDVRRQREIERLKGLATTLNLFVDNKKQLLESGNAASQKDMLRSHALGVAIRAEMIEKTARNLGI